MPRIPRIGRDKNEDDDDRERQAPAPADAEPDADGRLGRLDQLRMQFIVLDLQRPGDFRQHFTVLLCKGGRARKRAPFSDCIHSLCSFPRAPAAA
jgi:hypothetical protein